jgi:hypothetical protein
MVPRLCYDHTLHYVILFCEHEKHHLPNLKHAEILFIFIGLLSSLYKYYIDILK